MKNYDFSKSVKNPYATSARAEIASVQMNEILIDETPVTKVYLDLIKRSLEKVAPGYFKLKTTYEPSGIVRERVLCYELYHQIRSNMKDAELSLNGEIDKRGHIDFDPKDQKNPDFVFHLPGTHKGNTLVIEIKGTLARHAEIINDFTTILRFIGNYQYKGGVFIIYNHTVDELLKAVGSQLRKLASDAHASAVHILAIKEAGSPCEEVVLS